MAWPYCQPAKFSLYVDLRVLVQILSDTDQDIADPTNAGAANAAVVASALAAEALAAGAADMDQAMLEAKRYALADMQALADPPAQGVPDHGAYLRRLNAACAIRFLQQRRVRPGPEIKNLAAYGDWAEEELERIRTGQRIIPSSVGGTAGNQDAGLPTGVTSSVTEGAFPSRMFGQTDGPGVGYIDRLNRGYRDG